jgi:hypothetical protein
MRTREVRGIGIDAVGRLERYHAGKMCVSDTALARFRARECEVDESESDYLVWVFDPKMGAGAGLGVFALSGKRCPGGGSGARPLRSFHYRCICLSTDFFFLPI